MLLRKKIYQISLAAAVFAFGSLLFASSALAEKTNEIKVELWNGSEWKLLCQDEECKSSLKVFDTDNFLPGDTAERTVRITNKDITESGSGTEQEIAIEAINADNPYLGLPLISARFGDILNFKVEEAGGAIKYKKTLSEFFKENGEVVIAKLGNNDSEEFIFSVYFNDTGDDKYQKRSLGFDVIFGLKGEEGGTPPDSLPPGLTISNEPDAAVNLYGVIIKWTTSYPATSQVIYCRENESDCAFDLSDNSGNPPLYGYTQTTIEEDAPPGEYGVMAHEMELTGLLSDTIYYYRTVSHASPPTISRNYSFITLGKNEEAAQANKAANEASRENQIAFNQSAENISEENDNNFSDFSLILNKLFTIIIGGAMLAGLLYFGYRTKNKKN